MSLEIRAHWGATSTATVGKNYTTTVASFAAAAAAAACECVDSLGGDFVGAEDGAAAAGAVRSLRTCRAECRDL